MGNLNSARVREIISKNQYLTIATVSEDRSPWNSPVYFAYDENYNLYWASDEYSNHSQNIKNDPRVFIVIYNSTTPEGVGEGVYIQAVAVQLNEEEEINKAFNLLIRRGHSFPWKIQEFLDNSRTKIYKAKPEYIWINGERKSSQTYTHTREEATLE